MNRDRAVLINEIRYSERICQRTARLYRHLQTAGTFAAIVGGSATLTALSSAVPSWVSITGAAAFTIFGAALVATRPADKAAANEADMRRYAKLRTEAARMEAPAVAEALAKLRETDVPEVESLRAVAYNDVMHEIGQHQAVMPLGLREKMAAILA